MDEKTLQALTALATKLGTTAEYLWGVLIRQAPITGTIDLIMMACWVIGVVMWARFARHKTTRPPKTNENPYPRAEWEEEGMAMACVSVFFLSVVTAWIVGAGISDAVSALVNPEYWALRQILK